MPCPPGCPGWAPGRGQVVSQGALAGRAREADHLTLTPKVWTVDLVADQWLLPGMPSAGSSTPPNPPVSGPGSTPSPPSPMASAEPAPRIIVLPHPLPRSRVISPPGSRAVALFCAIHPGYAATCAIGSRGDVMAEKNRCQGPGLLKLGFRGVGGGVDSSLARGQAEVSH
jgi:hypothetical protein